ncbi:class I SAM-dependent methyltransferase [Sphingomonas solaris]|uniref:Class I SAM-dependent methyltransferase n=1 Tax=Alterirhizorhabdus solaris TaxID=2529389 RepID=A0A558QX33_9SPHN|nr:class I SAM-dependent methyltransferase [Sphingomonas solaris]TVV71700.1 class I SAM-dependent methyltransferase [Sphingomonas solaris]
MSLYLVSFSGRLEAHAEATRAELRKWGATNLWDDTWVVEMDRAPEECLPGFVQTEAAFAMPLQGADMFFSIGRAAGVPAQLVYTEHVAPQLLAADRGGALATIRYCNGGEAVFARAVDHYLATRRDSVWATDLCRLMAGHGSDKGIGWHTYTPFYQALFLGRRETLTALFELGLGTNNEDTPSNMGRHGTPGASLRGWRDFFPNARIYGADVDRRVLFAEDRIETFFVDQCDAETFAAMWAKLPDVELDVFVDDGLHTFDAARLTLDHAIGRVKSGGHYIIEDVLRQDVDAYLGLIAARGLPGMSIDIDHPANIYDNCLVVAAIP